MPTGRWDSGDRTRIGIAFVALGALIAVGLAERSELAPAASVRPTAAIPADFEVALGRGGGITGGWRVARLHADGHLAVEFSTVGHRDSEVEAGRLADAQRGELWTLLEASDFGALGCTPGNMTEDMELRANGMTQRACAPMGGGSADFRRIRGELERLIGTPTAEVRPPPPPLPPLPFLLYFEVQRGSQRYRIARGAAPLPPELAEDARLISDADLDAPWRAVFGSHFYSGASVELRDGVPLPGAPYSCGADTSVRITVGTESTRETRQRCVEGDAQVSALADLIVAAATRQP